MSDKKSVQAGVLLIRAIKTSPAPVDEKVIGGVLLVVKSIGISATDQDIKALRSCPSRNNPVTLLEILDPSKKKLFGSHVESCTTDRLLKAIRAEAAKGGQGGGSGLVDKDAVQMWESNSWWTLEEEDSKKSGESGVSFDAFISCVKQELEQSRSSRFRHEAGTLLNMRHSVLRVLRLEWLGNQHYLKASDVQDLIDASASYELFGSILERCVAILEKIKLPPTCAALGEIVEFVKLKDPQKMLSVLRDNRVEFSEIKKESTLSVVEFLMRAGIEEVDAKDMALGIYQRHRNSLPNQCHTYSLIEKGREALKNKDKTALFADCHLDATSFQAEVQGIKENTNLVSLSIARNNIHALGASAVCGIVSDLPNLIELNASGNNLQASGVRQVLTTCWTKLQTLDVSCCHAGAEVLSLLIELFDNNKTSCQIRSLSLSGNNIGIKGAERAAEVFKRCNRQLQSLYLGANKLGDSFALELANALKESSTGGDDRNTTTLQHLSLSNNNITDAGVIALAKALQANTAISLHVLDVSANPISDVAVQELAKAASTNPFLVEVRVDKCTKVTPQGKEMLALQRACEANVKQRMAKTEALRAKFLGEWSSEDLHWYMQHAARQNTNNIPPSTLSAFFSKTSSGGAQFIGLKGDSRKKLLGDDEVLWKIVTELTDELYTFRH